MVNPKWETIMTQHVAQQVSVRLTNTFSLKTPTRNWVTNSMRQNTNRLVTSCWVDISQIWHDIFGEYVSSPICESSDSWIWHLVIWGQMERILRYNSCEPTVLLTNWWYPTSFKIWSSMLGRSSFRWLYYGTPQTHWSASLFQRVLFFSQALHTKPWERNLLRIVWLEWFLSQQVFSNHTWVKTQFSALDKELNQKSDSIFFAKVENDGFSLGAQRNAISKNDLPSLTADIVEYLNGAASNSLDTKSKEEIADDGLFSILMAK